MVKQSKNTTARSSVKSIADEMDEALDNLEAKMKAVTKRINSILKVK